MATTVKYQRISRKPILNTELPTLVLVICSNTRNFHKAINIRYIYWSFGFCIDEPCYDEIMEVAREMNRLENWIVIEAECYSCTHGVPL